MNKSMLKIMIVNLALLLLVLTAFSEFKLNRLSFENMSFTNQAYAQKIKPGSSSGHTKSNGLYHYQASTGECVNLEGERGYNPVQINVLFDGLTEEILRSEKYQPKQVYLNKNAECVDFTNFDFNRIIKLSYVRLENWNLKGAILKNAAFTFAKMIKADLRGTKLTDISIGYTYISGSIDKFTKYPKFCLPQRPSRHETTKRIVCEL